MPTKFDYAVSRIGNKIKNLCRRLFAAYLKTLEPIRKKENLPGMCLGNFFTPPIIDAINFIPYQYCSNIMRTLHVTYRVVDNCTHFDFPTLYDHLLFKV